MRYKTTGHSTLYYKWLIGDLDKPKKRKRGNNE